MHSNRVSLSVRATARLIPAPPSQAISIRQPPTTAQAKNNMVIYDIQQTGLSSADFLAELARRKVLGVPVDAEKIRMVTHLDVDRKDVEEAVETIREMLKSHL